MDQNNMGSSMGEGKTCNCVHHKVVPWMIILIGIVVLLNAFSFMWLNSMMQMIIIGIALIVIGGTKLNGQNCKCCNHDKMKM